MPAPQYALAGKTGRLLPQGIADGNEQELRLDRYGGLLVSSIWPGLQALAEEGSFFVAGNATPGTGIALNTQVTAFADTTGFMVIQNRSQYGQRVYPVYLKLIVTTAATATTDMEFLGKIDYIDRSPVTAANGTALTLFNTNGDQSVAAPGVNVIAYANAGVMTLKAASGQARTVGRAHIATGVQVVLDEYMVVFGSPEMQSARGLTAARATDTGRLAGYMPPVAIGPNQDYVLHQWTLAAGTGPNAFEYEWGFVIR